MKVREAAADERLYIGIDLGTSGAEGMLMDADGKQRASFRTSYQSTFPQPGHVEQAPDEDWWSSVVRICRFLTEDSAGRIAGVAVSGLGPCVVVANENGDVLRPAILYGVDTRSTELIAELNRAADSGDEPLTTQAVGPKLMWVRQHEPDIWNAAARVFSSHTYVAFRFSGAYYIDRVSAELWAPFWDAEHSTWRTAAVDRLVPGVSLPPVVEPSAVVGRVSVTAARETGIPIGVPVIAGTIDFAAEVVGAGAADPGDCVIVYGSTLSINQVTKDVEAARGLLTSAGVEPDTRYVGGVTSAAGLALDWVRQLTKGSYESLSAAAQNVPPGCDGVTMIPHLAGERSPGFNENATGSIVGLRQGFGEAHIFRAALEAVAYSARSILDPLVTTIGKPQRVIAVGGASKNSALLQIVSDVCDIEQVVISEHTGAAYGAALLCLSGATGTRAACGRQRASSLVIRPRSHKTSTYDTSYARYREVDRRLQEIAAIGEKGING